MTNLLIKEIIDINDKMGNDILKPILNILISINSFWIAPDHQAKEIQEHIDHLINLLNSFYRD